MAKNFAMSVARSGKYAAVHSGASAVSSPGSTRPPMMRFKVLQSQQLGEVCSIRHLGEGGVAGS